MANAFATGDIVQLKSGGPKMTVETINEGYGDEKIKCKWFSGSKLQQGWFLPESLVKVEESDE
ncbi:MAG: DUF2158 domain-containing protein [Candidatus Marinimicrobia bacterium]|nr:DUF2158 domain-containing protein [Candidatus Neomarinimicrobiota bacterium]